MSDPRALLRLVPWTPLPGDDPRATPPAATWRCPCRDPHCGGAACDEALPVGWRAGDAAAFLRDIGADPGDEPPPEAA